MSARSEEKAQFYDDILVTLFDGAYGAIEQFGLGLVTVCEMNGKGDRAFTDDGYAEFFYLDTADTIHHVTAGTIAHAFTILNDESKTIKYLSDNARHDYRDAYRNNDAGDIDAVAATNILEIALFGEVVYG
jgi:hypothetical protein